MTAELAGVAIGTAVTAVISTAGLLLNRQAERRLRLDSAMQASGHLTADATPPTSAAALLTLSDLGQIQLAMALLVDLWRRDAIVPETAILLVGRALQSRHEPVNLMAAEMLWHKAGSLNVRLSTHWPRCLDQRWPVRMPPMTRLIIVHALLKATFVQSADRDTLSVLASRLYTVAQAESDIALKSLAAHMLRAVLPVMQRIGLRSICHAPDYVSLCHIASMAAPRVDEGGFSGHPLWIASEKYLYQLDEWLRPLSRAESDPALRSPADISSC